MSENCCSFHILEPHPSLAPWVRFYWLLKVEELNEPAVPELLLPDTYAEIIFNLIQAPYERNVPGLHSGSAQPSGSYVVASGGRPVLAKRISQVNMVGIKLHPRALFELLDVPMNYLANRAVSLNDLADPDLLHLESQVLQQKNHHGLKNLLDRYFYERLMTCKDSTASRAMRLINQHYGLLSIKEVVEQLNVHYSTLDKGFKKHCGMSPKAYQRMIRFRHCYAALKGQLLKGRYDSSFYDWGYFDQNHLIKDFRYYTLSAPTALLTTDHDYSVEITHEHLNRDLQVAST